MTKWPKKVKHRDKVLAKIYRPCAGRGSNRVAWCVSGKRMMKSFRTYGGKGGALEYAEALVPDLAKGSQVTALTPGQASDALAAFERLQRFYQSTGCRLTLLEAVSDCCEAMQKPPATPWARLWSGSWPPWRSCSGNRWPKLWRNSAKRRRN